MTDDVSGRVDRDNELQLADEAATAQLGAALSAAVPGPALIFLSGDLGAGKTTLVRAWLRGLGYAGPARSPTYTLVEPYEIAGRRIYHFDLYRLADPEELEDIGWRDYADGESLCLIEWPERAEGVLPVPDLHIRLTPVGEGRVARLTAHSEAGHAAVARLI